MVATYETFLDEVLAEVREILIAKHHDYGVNNLKKRGLLGIQVRLDDKMARIDNLLGVETKVDDESIRKTYLDIAGYAIQAVLLDDNKL